MPRLLDDKFRDFLRTVDVEATDPDTLVMMERAFKLGGLLTVQMFSKAKSCTERDDLQSVLLQEIDEFMETIPCTCGQCHLHESGNRGSRGG